MSSVVVTGLIDGRLEEPHHEHEPQRGVQPFLRLGAVKDGEGGQRESHSLRQGE